MPTVGCNMSLSTIIHFKMIQPMTSEFRTNNNAMCVRACLLTPTKSIQLMETRFPRPLTAGACFVFLAIGTRDSLIAGRLLLPPLLGFVPKIFPIRLLSSMRPPWGRSCGFPTRRAYDCCQATSDRRASLVVQRLSRCWKIRKHLASLLHGGLRGFVPVRLVSADVVVEWER
jgi:hypothetical protein